MARSLFATTQFSTGSENWTQGKSVLGTVDQAEVYVAHDEVRAYANLKHKRNQKQTRKNDEIPDEIASLEAEIEKLKKRKSNLRLEEIDDEERARREQEARDVMQAHFAEPHPDEPTQHPSVEE
jgi:cell division protein FtsB